MSSKFWRRICFLFIEFIFIYQVICSSEHFTLLKDEDLTIKSNFRHLIQRLYKEERFYTILLMYSEFGDCIDEGLSNQFYFPIIRIAANETIDLVRNYNKEILGLICINPETFQSISTLYTLAESFQGMRDRRVVVLVHEISKDVEIRQTYLNEFFVTCIQINMRNVIILESALLTTYEYVSYTSYPKFQLEYKSFIGDGRIFDGFHQNFMGKQMYVSPSKQLPKMILNLDSNLTDSSEGIFGMFLRSYAEIYNVKINYDIVESGTDLTEMLENSTTDMAITAKVFNTNTEPLSNSVLIYIGQYVVALPMEKPLSKDKILFDTINEINVLVHLMCSFIISGFIAMLEVRNMRGIFRTIEVYFRMDQIRGLLGFAIRIPKKSGYLLSFAYLLMTVQGFFNAAIYTANLGFKLTIIPKEKQIESFDDILERGHPKILTSLPIESLFPDGKGGKYLPTFVYTNESEEILFDNIFINPDYAYNMFTEFWKLLDKVQKRYDTKLFRLAPKIRYPLVSPVIFGFIFPEGSAFQKSIHMCFLRAIEGGLPEIWHYASSPTIQQKCETGPEPLTISEFKTLLLFFMIAQCISSIVLMAEVAYNKIHKTK